MSLGMKLTFGKHAGKRLSEVAEADPAYVVWLAGIVTKHSLKTEVLTAWKEIDMKHPETIAHAREFVEGKCLSCLQHSYNPRQPCSKSRQTRNYQYHPYGKRD